MHYEKVAPSVPKLLKEIIIASTKSSRFSEKNDDGGGETF